MKVVHAPPPNFDILVRHFPLATRPEVVFTYGDKIYTPGGMKISPALMAHESIHAARQGADPDGWWRRYLAEVGFRYQEELLAHRAEYAYYRHYGRNQRRRQLKLIAGRLASPLYGNMVKPAQARRDISHA